MGGWVGAAFTTVLTVAYIALLHYPSALEWAGLCMCPRSLLKPPAPLTLSFFFTPPKHPTGMFSLPHFGCWQGAVGVDV